MGKMQREKGVKFERWTAEQFRAAGFAEAKRGVGQPRSASECPDVIGVRWWVECKHQIRVNIRKAWEQADYAEAVRCALSGGPEDHIPALVVSKDNGKEPLATLTLDDFLALVREREHLRGQVAHLDAALKEASDAAVSAATKESA